MKPVFQQRSLGRSLTEYKRVNYDVLVKQCERFILYSQFDTTVGRYIDEPKCGIGEILKGVDSLGNEHELMSIIDSSD